MVIARASIRGSDGSAYASSMATKPNSRTTAGQSPSQAGYGRGSRDQPSLPAVQATASAAARQGSSTDQTFPSTIESTTMPTQKMT